MFFDLHHFHAKFHHQSLGVLNTAKVTELMSVTISNVGHASYI
jgi:hypothetical protein